MKKTIGVIFGGRSEHLGSIQHALDVIQNLKENDEYEVVAVYITKQGAWIRYRNGMSLPFDSTVSDINILINPQQKGFIELSNTFKIIPLDFVFPLVLGDIGEDGSLSGMLELAQIPYAGSSVLGSALGMDKIAFKMMLDSHHLPNTPYCYTTRLRWEKNRHEVYNICKQHLELPWFVKPANMGSSIGISKVYKHDEFEAAIEEAAQYDSRILIEEAVKEPKEIEVAVLGNDSLLISSPGEIRCSRDFFSHTAKYYNGMTQILIPPPDMPKEMIATFQDYASTVFRLLNCSGFARVDFLIRGIDNKIFISEINTVPGLSPTLMFPHLWKAEGYSYSDILRKIISLGFEAFAEKQKNKVLGWNVHPKTID